MNNTITGNWFGHYEYGQGQGNEPHASEHRIKFAKVKDKWIGKSLPNDEGSEVTLTLTQNGDEFAGEWHEQTSPMGHYSGRQFSGLILLLLQNNGTELNGMWLGASSRSKQVKAGKWTLKREPLAA